MTNHDTQPLPSGWEIASISEVCTLDTGSPAPQLPSLFTDGTRPFVRVQDLGRLANNVYIRDTKDHLNDTGTGGLKLFREGAVLFTKSGMSALLNQRAILARDMHVVSHIGIATPLGGIPSEYIYYWLKTVDFSGLTHATTLPSLPMSRVGSLRLPLPPLSEQDRIVAEIEKQLTRLDAAVAALERARVNLKRYRVAVLKAACEGQLVPTEADLARSQGRDYEPADALLTRIQKERREKWEADQRTKMKAVDKHPKDDGWKGKYVEPESPEAAELPRLSEGWVWARAEQVCEFITKGTTPAANKLQAGVGDIPFIKVYNLTFDGKLDFSVNPTFVSTDTHKKELARSRVVPGDVLMNIVGPPLGKVAVVPATFDEWNMNQAVAVFRPLFGVLRGYLAICLLAGDVLNWATRRAKATAGQFNLTLEICRDLPLPIPPAKEQARIVIEAERRLSVLDETEALVNRSLRRADRMRQAILKQAFEGRLVDQDPNDEPASALLERIHLTRAASSITRAIEARS